MKEYAPQLSPDELNSLFAQLNPLDVEQFYTVYQLWSTQQRIQTLQALMDAIQRDIAENTECLEQIHPSALALATLARLQAHGVSDITMLDRMLERGEEWLDRTMQRLEYCEKIDVISGDYTKWCEHALEGAYDWIDSIQEHEAVDYVPIEFPSSEAAISEENGTIEDEATRESNEPDNEIMEELFLQKLMSEDPETIEATETTEAIADTVNGNVDNADNAGNTLPTRSELTILPTEQETRPEEVNSTPVLEETQAEHIDVLSPTLTPVINYGNIPNQATALPPTVAPTTRKRGVVRTLITVLFHV